MNPAIIVCWTTNVLMGIPELGLNWSRVQGGLQKILLLVWMVIVISHVPISFAGTEDGQIMDLGKSKNCTIQGKVSPIPDDIWRRMQGTSWHPELGCPPRNQLRYLQIPYYDFSMVPQMGEMIVSRAVAKDVLSAFIEIFCSGQFMIAKMRLTHHYQGSDPDSMDDNNTSGFNCRLTSNGGRLSEHSLGMAIDINPIQNPYVRKDITLPPAGHPFDEISERVEPGPGMIKAGDIVNRALANIGWKWGGEWRNSKDYQHFSRSGR